VYTPDNYYFQTIYELGVLGLWFFLLLLAGAFMATRSVAARARGPDADLAWGVTASVVAAAASSLVAAYFEFFPVDLLFWLMLAVVATITPRVVSRSPQPLSS
jgi:hypothetical protein